jgi:phosphate transport system ATP-binding protein
MTKTDKNRYPWQSGLKQSECCDPLVKIEVQKLSLSYGNHLAFKDITLNINKGCVTGIIGPSGCGKSSFVQCLNRMSDMFNSVKIDGDIFIDGHNIFDTRQDLIALRRKVGIVFQEPTPLPLSISSNIELPLKEHGFDRIQERIKSALVDVGLWSEVKDKLKTPANNLSGGQKQRLCLARTIALEPEVILMDEPCSSLDPIATERIESLIEKFRGRYTILVVTHNLAQARRICDHIHAFWFNDELNCGEVVESGTCAQIFENPQNTTVREYIEGFRG